MLHATAFTAWMTGQKYPPKTPRVYLRDIERVEARLGMAMEPVSVANTNQILNAIGNEGPARTDKHIANDRSAINCYHEFSTKQALPGYKRRGPRP